MSTDPTSPDFSFEEAWYEAQENAGGGGAKRGRHSRGAGTGAGGSSSNRRRQRGDDYTIGQYRKDRNKNQKKAQKTRAQRLNFNRQQQAAKERAAEADRELRREKLRREDAARAAGREARQKRDAQNLAQREQARLDREARYARQERARSGGTAPSFTTGTAGYAMPDASFSPDKATVAKVIILATALGAIGAVANDLRGSPAPLQFTTANGVKVQIPAHLHTLGGAFVAGTIALVVNEIYPAAGAVLAAGIFFIVVIPAWTGRNGLLPRLGGGLFPATSSQGPRGNLYRPRGNGAAPPQLGKDPNTGLPVPTA